MYIWSKDFINIVVCKIIMDLDVVAEKSDLHKLPSTMEMFQISFVMLVGLGMSTLFDYYLSIL